MRVLFVATYPELGASSRYRICQFLPALEARGVSCHFEPLLSNEFFKRFYLPGGFAYKGFGLIKASLKRLFGLIEAGRYDVVFVQREAALIGPPVYEFLVKYALRRPVVFDLDDAIFHAPATTKQSSPHRRLGQLLKSARKADQIAQIADEVIAASEYTARWARRFNENVTVIPTVVDGDVFRPFPEQRERVAQGLEPPVIGWVGSHSAAPQLELVLPALERLAKKHRFSLKLVGAGREFSVPGVEVRNVKWSLDTEVDDFRSLDVGLCPLFDDAWSLGKPGFKPIVYMACGVPQVVSPIGGVTEFFVDGAHGFFARNEDEWFETLDRLLSDHALRARQGQAGRELFERSFSLEAVTPTLIAVLERAAKRRALRGAA